MLLIDFSPLKAGGGCQLALNFIYELNNQRSENLKFIFLIPDTGPLKDLPTQFPNFFFIVSPSSSVFKRVFFEYYSLQKILIKKGVDKIFTFFGPGLPHKANVKSIVSVAYPIICYDESIFWKHLPLKKYIKQKIINYARLQRLHNADFIIAETPVMAERLSTVLHKAHHEFIISPPAPSEFVSERNALVKSGNNISKFLFLSGVAPHKNLWRLPEICFELLNNIDNFVFMISSSKEAFISHLSNTQKKLFSKVSKHFNFLGTIAPDEINNVYQEADFLVSLSDLESFSNNYMEAWKVGIPLIVSDRDFSRAICKNSAIYIEPHNPHEVASTIVNVLNNPTKLKNIIAEGKELLKTLPEVNMKSKHLLSIIDAV